MLRPVLLFIVLAASVMLHGEVCYAQNDAGSPVASSKGDTVELVLIEDKPHITPAIGIDGSGSSVPAKNDWFYKKRAWPNETIDPEHYFDALNDARNMPQFRSGGGKNRSQSDLQWKQIGPYEVGGRVTALAMHPTDPNIFYVGAASGGVWKTTDRGRTFRNLTDTFSTLPVGSLAIDPSDPQTIYLGQGECNYSADSWPGNGMWKSTNGGDSWMYLGLAMTQYIAKIIIDPNDTRSIFIAAAGPASLSDTNRGVFHSTDGGLSWKRLLLVRQRAGATLPIIDLAMNPRNSSEIVAAGWDRASGLGGPATGLWHTTDAGGTWTRIDTLDVGYASGVGYKNLNRTVLHWANTQPLPTLYAAVSRLDTNELTGRVSNANFHGLYSTTSPAIAWRKLQDSTMRMHYGGLNLDSADILHKQGYYNFYLAGNPHRPDEIYIGAIDVHRSTNQGKTFSNLTRSYGDHYFKNDRRQHPDQHALGFTADPSGTDLFVGSDGGVYHTNDHGATWEHMKGMPITMFYAIEPWYGGMKHLGSSIIADSLWLMGGTQDNGSVSVGLTKSTDWEMINNADGGVAVAHSTDPEKIFTSKQNGRIYLRVSLDSLTSNVGPDDREYPPDVYRTRWIPVTRSLLTGPTRLTDTSEPVTFIAPFVLDREHPTDLFTGRTRIYRAKVNYDRPDETRWSVWSPYFFGDTTNSRSWTGLATEAIAIGARDENGRPMLWAGGAMTTKTGGYARSIWRTAVDPLLHADSAPRWVSARGNLPTAIPSTILADPYDSLTAFIAFSNYATGRTVYKTTDGGIKWANISGNLPRASVNSLVIDTLAAGSDPAKRHKVLIAATDVGVFISTTGGTEWSTLGSGLPRLVVNDVDIYKNLLIAGTHGRSAWTIDLTSIRASLSVQDPTDDGIRELSVFPNPVSLGSNRSLRFGLPTAVSIRSAELVNVATGNSFSFDAPRAGSTYELGLNSDVQPGIYLLTVIAIDGTVHRSKVSILH